jgi:hypothetical protein
MGVFIEICVKHPGGQTRIAVTEMHGVRGSISIVTGMQMNLVSYFL